MQPLLFSALPLRKAFSQADTFIHDIVAEENGLTQGPLTWKPINVIQDYLLSEWAAYGHDLSLLDPTEVDGMGTWKYDQMKRFFAHHQLPFNMKPWAENRDNFGVVGLIQYLQDMAEFGVSGYRLPNGKPAFRFDHNSMVKPIYFSYENVRGAILKMANGDNLYLMDQLNASSVWELNTSLPELLKYAEHFHRGYTGVVTAGWSLPPMEVNISDIHGVYAVDVAKNNWRVKNTLYVAESSFGPWGIYFKAAAAVNMTRECIMMPQLPLETDLVLGGHDRGITFCIRRPGMNKLLACGTIPVDKLANEEVAKPQGKINQPFAG